MTTPFRGDVTRNDSAMATAGLLDQLGSALEAASISLTELDPMGAHHEPVALDEALGAYRRYVQATPDLTSTAYLDRLRDLCERAGVELAVESDPDGPLERWTWKSESGAFAEEMLGFDSEEKAARSGLEAKFGEGWRLDVRNGDTQRGFLDYVEAELEQVEDEMRMKP